LISYSNYTPFFLFEKAFNKLFVSEKKQFFIKELIFSVVERVLKYSLIVIVVVMEFFE